MKSSTSVGAPKVDGVGRPILSDRGQGDCSFVKDVYDDFDVLVGS